MRGRQGPFPKGSDNKPKTRVRIIAPVPIVVPQALVAAQYAVPLAVDAVRAARRALANRVFSRRCHLPHASRASAPDRVPAAEQAIRPQAVLYLGRHGVEVAADRVVASVNNVVAHGEFRKVGFSE